MRRILFTLAACAVAGTIWAARAGLGGPSDLPAMIVVTPDGAVSEHKSCATGCSAPTPDEHSPLTEEELAEVLATYQSEPPISDGPGLETLLFHGNAHTTQHLLETHGYGPLDAAHRHALDTELSRDRARIRFRLVDAEERIRGTIDEVIPLKVKQHLVLEGTGRLKRAEVNGKVKRVGLHHLWTRW